MYVYLLLPAFFLFPALLRELALFYFLRRAMYLLLRQRSSIKCPGICFLISVYGKGRI